ncbi:MAG TPA: hypothetical protein VGT44_13060, partial [Ktedonobacteraceae bacterium]|nr:hypothetical protein [Ktedonobacteraceae bacterium]
QVIGRLKRYRIVAKMAALVMSIGALLIALMTPATGIVLAISILVLTGIGIGPFFTLPMLVVQNSLPADRLGISTAGLRYLGQLGASLGIAIVGTVVTSSVSGNMMNHLPTNATSKLALSAALQHGFFAVLIFALIALVSTFLLKEAQIVGTQETFPQEQAVEESDKELVTA